MGRRLQGQHSKPLILGSCLQVLSEQYDNPAYLRCQSVSNMRQAFVIYVLYQEVFSTDSKTRHFNKAVDQVRTDPRALELLGSRKTIRAFGEPSGNKWTRNRPLASSIQTDRAGIEHFRMHFNVEGSEKSGVVSMHMEKAPGDTLYKYRYLALDVPGHPRLYLENANDIADKKKPGFRMLGIQWK